MKLPERWSGLYTVTAGSKLINSASHKHVQSQVRLRGTAGTHLLQPCIEGLYQHTARLELSGRQPQIGRKGRKRQLADLWRNLRSSGKSIRRGTS